MDSNAPVTPTKTKGKDHAAAEALQLESTIGSQRGYWWRAKRYALEDGRIVPIGPVRQYDPATSTPLPHDDLFDVAQKLRLLDDKPPRIEEIDPSPILDWCLRYGLLGILPARLIQIRVAEVWGASPRWQTLEPLLPVAQIYTRTPTGWQQQSSPRLPNNWSMSARDGAKQGKLIPLRLAPVEPQVILLDWQARNYRVGTPAALGINHFFGVAARDANVYQYPMPLSPAFWSQYGEPLPLVAKVISQLARAIAGIGSKATNDFDNVNWMLSGAQPFIQPAKIADAATRDGLTMPTLLHTMAEAIRRDFLADARPRKCPKCGTLFSGRVPSKVYCGPPCQHQFKQREYRRRLRDAKGD